MSFSPSQQGIFRPMVNAAWSAVCRTSGRDPKDKIAKREWYECELLEATGYSSTSACNSRGDFEAAMAHFEEISGESITWQMRRHNGDRRRLIFAIREICQKFDFSEEYAAGVAAQATRQSTANLDRLDGVQLLAVLRALKIQGRRHQQAEKSLAENEPF